MRLTTAAKAGESHHPISSLAAVNWAPICDTNSNSSVTFIVAILLQLLRRA